MIRVKDTFRNYVSVNVEYPRLPPKCNYYGEFGHLSMCYPSTIVPYKPIEVPESQLLGTTQPWDQDQKSPLSPKNDKSHNAFSSPQLVASSSSKPKSRASNSPAWVESKDYGWTLVIRKSRHVPPCPTKNQIQLSEKPHTSAHLLEDANIVEAAQRILCNISCSQPPLQQGTSQKVSLGLSNTSKKKAKKRSKKQMQQMKHILQAHSRSFS